MRSTGTTKRTALEQISSANRQQITNNYSSSTFSTARRLSAYQLALLTELQREIPKTFKHTCTPKRFKDVQNPRVFIFCGRMWRHRKILEESP
ncbi:hypothetical protein AVEN_269597-1 [Araneus ventricosus]|uniref:Uncharacterized protein n=1 Tax=Araneus ventricosus TaxID=182803 RepID=A0A4Y2CDF0_ARAVE|nr:hypothetical protein AVEN_269597-1 [Araneus ventricosus]